MFGIPLGPLAVADGPSMPTNTPEDMSALQRLHAAVAAHNRTPNGRVARGFDQFGPQPTGPVAPMLPTPPTPAPVNITPQQAAPTPPALSSAMAQAPTPPSAPAGPVSVGGAPLPNVGPTSVGGAPLGAPAPTATPPMGFFQRNTAMMRDPSTGAFIDPGMAATAQSQQASGPDVINKLMSYFHKKDNPSDG